MKGMLRNDGVALRGALARAVCFLGLWLVLAGADVADLPAGVLASIAATWTSLRLSPSSQAHFRPTPLARLILRFLQQSVVAGVDVAWRALDPRLPLRPGFILCRSRLPPGLDQQAFCTMTSLLPGTLPCGRSGNDAIVVHCLDVTQPVADQLAAEEAVFVQALGRTNA